MENSNAPFAVNQKVIRTGKTVPGYFVEGKVYTVAHCRQCIKCGAWKVGIAEFPIIKEANVIWRSTCPCGYVLRPSPDSHFSGNAKNFAPIQHQYTDISKEILEKFPVTEETPDKIIVPEKVNN